MTLNISVPNATEELRPKITVVGVGGAGGNAVNTMISAGLDGVEFLVANTDGQALSGTLAPRRIQLGKQQTRGLGAGSKPEVGNDAAEESIEDIIAELADSHMVFITAGMGGGTGTGAAPVIARACRERGILTVGVITKPFDFEGAARMAQADAGIEQLQAYVDTLIVIPNQNLFRLANERTTFADAFAAADQVLHQAVCGITDLMVKPGIINLDFADVRAIMAEMGKAMMGTGEASGENRAINAAEAAINNPLLDETSMKGAQAVLINISGGGDMTLFEVDEAANHIRREVDPDANIIFGSAFDDKLDGIMRVSVVATGMHDPKAATKGNGDLLGDPGLLAAGLASVAAKPATTARPQQPAAAQAGAPAFAATAAMAEPQAMPQPQEAEAPADGIHHDPNQHNLMDMVAEAEQGDGQADDHHHADAPAASGDGFIPGETGEADTADTAMPAAHAEHGREHKAGLFQQLSKVFLGRKAWESRTPAKAAANADRRDPVLDEAAAADAIPAEVAPAEAVPVEAAPAEDNVAELPQRPAATATATAPAPETAATAEAHNHNPAPAPAPQAEQEQKQEQLEIEKPAEDIDLEIPAFLRRQAN